MVSPVSSDRITSQTNEQGRATQKGASSSAEASTTESTASTSSAPTGDEVQVSDAGKLFSQSETRATGASTINTYEEASAAVESLKSSLQENGIEALSAHRLQAGQLSELLAPA